MKDTLWKLFEETGNTGYYLLYKEMQKKDKKRDGKK